LVGVREAAKLLRDDGRIVAITYEPGGRTGGLQPWAAMGAAKAVLETLVRYFAVTMARPGITVNAVSPGWTEDSVLNSLPAAAQTAIREWHLQGWTPDGPPGNAGGRWQRSRPSLPSRGRLGSPARSLSPMAERR
jgi:NAD(P)-dependent dehydrogenase (short-subunit alcohol dehydrogenase family)